jgi:hypothetical protein
MPHGLPINVLPADSNWSPTPAQLSDWRSKYPNDVFKANASNADWVDLNGSLVSTIPISLCGVTIYEWQIVSGKGDWVEISNTCRPPCKPVRPQEVPDAMPLGMQIAKPCN